MKIGINLIALPNEKGSGAFRYIQLLLQSIGKYELADCSFIVYKQKQISKEYLKIPGSLNVEYVDVPNVGQGFKRVLFEQTLFYLYLKKCDVLYSYCTSLPLFARTTKIFTLHDVYFYTMKERYGFLQRNYIKFITRLYCHFASKILTVSQYSKTEILRHYNIPESKLAITYNYVPPTSSKLQPIYSLKDYYGEEIILDVPFFLYVGNLQPGKNIKGMVDGFERFNQNSSVQYKLLIVGKPTNSGYKLIDYVKVKPGVHYLGFQSREIVEYLLSSCVSTVLLSFCEGFGIPPIEGFSYGKPSLVSNRTSLPEVVGDAGIIVNPDDIQDIAEGYKLVIEKRTKLVLNIDKQLRKFSEKESVETFLKILGVNYKHKTS